MKEIDDPNYTGTHGQSHAKEVICCPVFANDDLSKAGKEEMAAYPRCVVMLINKMPDPQTMQKVRRLEEHAEELLKSNSKFEPDDVKKLEMMCSVMGRCHDVVN